VERIAAAAVQQSRSRTGPHLLPPDIVVLASHLDHSAGCDLDADIVVLSGDPDKSAISSERQVGSVSLNLNRKLAARYRLLHPRACVTQPPVLRDGGLRGRICARSCHSNTNYTNCPTDLDHASTLAPIRRVSTKIMP
jgi:hypothetical protein